MKSLEGKIAVVLGASAEAGTGWAIAESLAAEGATVVVGARSEAPLKKLAAKIGGLAVACDACDEGQVKNLIDQTIKKYGRLDIAVNSAGAANLGMIADSTDELMQGALQLNFMGHLYFVKHVAAAMKQGGSIVLVSSLSTTHPMPPNFSYACAKSATDCLVRYAAIEYGSQNIRVNSILPGPIVSDMAKGFLDNPAIAAVFNKEIPMGRLGYPKDYANAVLWLAGPAYVTGLNIPICGGNQLLRFPQLNEMPGAGGTWEGQGKTLHDRDNSK